MKFYATKNQSLKATTETTPWDWPKTLDKKYCEDKAARMGFAADPATDWNFYTAVVGKDAGVRVGPENPMVEARGFVLDIDSKVPDVSKIRTLVMGFPMDQKASFVEITPSGNLRVVWILDAPVKCDGETYQKLITHLAGQVTATIKKSWSRVFKEKVEPVVDPASSNPTQLWTNSGTWVRNTGALVPAVWFDSLVEATLTREAPAFTSGTVNYEMLARVLKDTYPRFVEWKGEFKEGAIGPSFWVEGSTSPKSAMVMKGGLSSKAAHAAKRFYRWSELVKDFKAVDELNTGELCEGIWFDLRQYHWFGQLNASANSGLPALPSWLSTDKVDVLNAELYKRGVPLGAGIKNSEAPIDAVRHQIQTKNLVSAAAPFVFRKDGLYFYDNNCFLNTARVKPVQPCEKTGIKWGDGFPLIKALLGSDPVLDKDNGLISGGYAKRHVMTELKHMLMGAYNHTPVRGHAMFFVGGAGTGKDFFTNQVIGQLFGGFALATKYLKGEESFGSQLFERGVWTASDPEVCSDAEQLAWTLRAKNLVANPDQEYHKKFGIPAKIECTQRLVFTLNLDEKSLKGLPDLAISNGDKNNVYRVQPNKAMAMLETSQDANAARIRAELPFFARWLMEYEPLPDMYDPSSRRFEGIKAYQDAEIMRRANRHSTHGIAYSRLLEWRLARAGSASVNSDRIWSGPATSLTKEFRQVFDDEEMRNIRIANFPKALRWMADQQMIPGMEYREVNHIEHFFIPMFVKGFDDIHDVKELAPAPTFEDLKIADAIAKKKMSYEASTLYAENATLKSEHARMVAELAQLRALIPSK